MFEELALEHKTGSAVITSGEHPTKITTVPMGFTRKLINVDPISPLKMEFIRGNDVLQKYEMSINERLVPSIETDVTTLDSSAKSVNATISYGIQTPYELVRGTSFNYGALPKRCAAGEGVVELEFSSLLTDFYYGFNTYVGSTLDEITLNPNIDATFLVFREKERLNSAEYLSYETNLYSYIELGKHSSFVTYTEEGVMTGDLQAVLLSEPVSIQVENTAIELIEN